jgi:hypothetical protein
LFEVGAFEEVATQMAMMDALHSKASQKEGRNGLKQYKNAYLVEKGLKNVPASKKRASKKTKKTDVVESGAESGTETEVTKPKAKRGRPSSKAVSVPVTEVSEVVPAVSEVVPAEVAVDAVAVTETAVKEKKKRATSSKKTQKPQVVSPDE